LSKVVLGRAARCAGTVTAVAMLALAGSALADGPSGGSSGGEGYSGGGSSGSDAGNGSGNGTTAGSSCQSGGDSRHLGDRVLCQGMRGHDVRVLQAYLSDAGFSTAVDGAFGSGTKRNVIGFQRSHSMSTSGIVTVTVAHALRQAVAAVASSPPTGTTRINPDGTATAPSAAPTAVQRMVAAANQIIDKPYASGGGHGSWNDSAYDCSGAVSYVLHGAGMLSSPEDSTGLESYGQPGAGHWVTIYADAAHTWIVIAGRAFDTANYGGPNIPSGSGPRWRSNPTGNLADGGGYVIRHPDGL
jgi:peptidoglycan hydrolase-like protein with peptidoglycan-binding domain